MPGSISTAIAHANAPVPGITPAEREGLILEHLSQVRLIARRIHEQVPGLVSLEDMVSSGTVGLIAAIDRFDAGQGVKLRTYAEFKIRGAILDSLRELDWAPRSRRQRARALVAATESAERRLHSTASVEDVAREMGLTIEQCHQWMRDTRQITFEPLDSVSAEQDGSVTTKQIAATGPDTEPERNIETEQLRAVLAEAIARMPGQERIVLSLIYHEDLSLREIARVMGVHESRISQVKAQALKRMRELVEENWPRRGGAAKPASRV